MRHGSLFSGIGGFDLAAEWMGWKNVFHCEWNEFGQKVLKHYWPDAELFTDITKSDFKKYHGTIDIISGGFPCQPYSAAGKRLGKEDDRHLWPEMLRAIREIQPRWVVGENVFGLVNWSDGLVFHEVQTDLEAAGYEVFTYVLPAVSVGAPHRRDRIWFVAYALSVRLQQCEDSGEVGDRQSEVCGTRSELADGTEADGKVSDAPNTNRNGFGKQWRYDGGCKNDERGNSSVKRSANTKDFDPRNTSANFIGRQRIDGAIGSKENDEKEQFTNSTGICDLDKTSEQSKETIRIDGNEIVNSCTLVQNGQERIQLSEYRGVGENKESIQCSGVYGQENDNDKVDRMEGDAPNTNSDGFNQRHGKHEEQSSEGGFDAFGNIDEGDGDGDAADTNIGSEGTPGESGGVKSNRSADNVQQSERGSKAEQHNRPLAISRDAADTFGIRGGQDERLGHGEPNVINEIGKKRNATNTQRKRYEWLHKAGYKIDINGESAKIWGGFTGHDKKNDWANFPTVSPICVRDDGISDRLDSITFPKWRNESIKAAGNAIVPQVVYQIFKAIEQYEQLNTTTT